jgi:hypothetical protein
LVIAPAERSLSYAFSVWAEYPTNNVPPDAPLLWGLTPFLHDVPWARVVTFLVWASVTSGILVFASWPEPTKPRRKFTEVGR